MKSCELTELEHSTLPFGFSNTQAAFIQKLCDDGILLSGYTTTPNSKIAYDTKKQRMLCLVAATRDWEYPWYIDFALDGTDDPRCKIYFNPKAIYRYYKGYHSESANEAPEFLKELPKVHTAEKQAALEQVDTICRDWLQVPFKTFMRLFQESPLTRTDTMKRTELMVLRDFWHEHPEEAEATKTDISYDVLVSVDSEQVKLLHCPGIDSVLRELTFIYGQFDCMFFKPIFAFNKLEVPESMTPAEEDDFCRALTDKFVISNSKETHEVEIQVNRNLIRIAE